MTTVFQLNSIVVLKDMVLGWCIKIGEAPTACVFNCNNTVLLQHVVKTFRDNPTMARTMGDFFEVTQERIHQLELKEAKEAISQSCAKAKTDLILFRTEMEKCQTLIKRLDNRAALLSLINLPGEWVTAEFTGHHSEDSLGDFVKTLRIKNGVLESMSSYKPQEEYRTAWINLNTLVAHSHIDENEMTQYSGPTKGDAIYAWCKRTMERFW